MMRMFIVLVFMVIIMGNVLATEITKCGEKLAGYDTYYMTGELNCPGQVNAIRPGLHDTIDCQGNAIVGDNASGATGIYIGNSRYTTIKNCVIRDFGQYGIYAYNGIALTIQNCTLINDGASGGDGIFLYNELAGTINNTTVINEPSLGMEADGADNLLINNSHFEGDVYGIYLGQASYAITIRNTFIRSAGTGGNALYSDGGAFVIADNDILLANTGYAFYAWAGNNNTLINSILESNASSQGMQTADFDTGEFDTTIRNNTFVADDGLTDHLLLNGEGYNTSVCLNNFTSTSGSYIVDMVGGTDYNCTFDGKNQGNIWYDASAIAGAQNSSIVGYGIGETGDVPYSGHGHIDCSGGGCIDYAPLFLNGWAIQASNNTTSNMTCPVCGSCGGWAGDYVVPQNNSTSGNLPPQDDNGAFTYFNAFKDRLGHSFIEWYNSSAFGIKNADYAVVFVLLAAVALNRRENK